MLICLTIVAAQSCTTQMGVSNGGYTDISLTRESKDYKLKKLKVVTSEAKSVFGIPLNKASQKSGFIVRFNGINLSASGSFLPTLSMIGLSLATGYVINDLAGKKEKTVDSDYGGSYTYKTNEDNLGLIPSTILAIPIAGAINNQIWAGSAYKMAAFNLNSKLIDENSDIDIFTNPKYDITNKLDLWTQDASIKAKVMGVVLKADEDFSHLESEPNVTTINVKFEYPSECKLWIDNIKREKSPYTVSLEKQKHKIEFISYLKSQKFILDLTNTIKDTVVVFSQPVANENKVTDGSLSKTAIKPMPILPLQQKK